MKRGRKTFWCAVLLASAAAGPRVETARGWNPPAGPGNNSAFAPSDKSFKPTAHSAIITEALKVLEGDGLTAVADFYRPFQKQLLDGARQADRGGGDAELNIKGPLPVAGVAVPVFIDLVSKPVEKNSHSHFYNPSTGRGLVLDLSGPINLIAADARAKTLFDWPVWSLFGPHAAATDLADLSYAQAVDAMRRGDKNKAMTHMGWALHYVADLCVPQHATDQSGVTPLSNHREFEDHADTLLGTSITHATSGGVYRNLWKPSDYLKEAARLSIPHLEDARKTDTFDKAAKAMIPAAERLTAGLMRRFHDLWATENFTVVAVTVDRVKATSAVDNENEADFYAKVTIDGRTYTTGSLDGGDDVQPNKFATFNWVFPKWVDKPRDLKAEADDADADAAPQAARLWPPRAPDFAAALLNASFQPSVQRRPKITFPVNTSLEVLTLGSPGKEFEEWGRKLVETGKPRVLTFRWGTKEDGVASARWEVVTKNAAGEATAVASGDLKGVPKAGRTEMFNVDFAKFAPSSPPSTPKSYAVRVIALDANNNSVGLPSPPAVVTFQKPGPAVKFNMRPAVHPQVRVTAFGRDPRSDVSPAVLTVEVSNPGTTETDPAVLYISDKSHLYLPAPGQNIPRLKPGEHRELRLLAPPDTMYWYRKELAEKGGVVSDETSGWRGFFSTGSVNFEVQTHAFGHDLTDEVKNHRPLVTLARRPYPDPVAIALNLWDVDGGLSGGDDHCDISPRDGDKTLDFMYRLDGVVHGDVLEMGEPATTVVSATGNDGDERAQIWLTVRRFPVAPVYRTPAKPKITSKKKS